MTDEIGRPLVSFVVIAYNQERYIREAIEGAFAQTYSPLEIILSDDNSPDGTFGIMQEMAASYDGPHRLVLNRNEQNQGLVPHIDRVMEIVTGAFIVINAGDDVSFSERTEKLASKWESSGRKVKLVHSPVVTMDESGSSVGIRTSDEAIVRDPTPFVIVSGGHCILGASLSWDRDVFDSFGPLGPGLSVEDTTIPFRAALLGEIAYVEEPLVKYRQAGMTSAKFSRFTPYDYMYGFAHKCRKWQIENDMHILTRFTENSYLGKDEAEAACRDRVKRLGLTIELAQSSRVSRFLLAPRSVWLALRHRSFEPLKHWVMYSLEPLYLLYARAKRSLRTLFNGRTKL